MTRTELVEWRIEDFSRYDDNGRYEECYEIWSGEGETYQAARLNRTLHTIATCYSKPDADAILRLKDEAREAQQLRRGSLQAMLIEFHAAFGLTTNLGKPPAITDESPLRRELLREEYEEYIAAEDAGDLVELADALGDMAYVIYGTAIAYGIDLDAVVREIHRSNMTKLMPDGTVKRREDGKVQKGPNFVRPNINAALEASTTTQAGET